MAGIGFELRKFLKKDTYFGLMQAYSIAGLLSSGPWMLSIIGIILVSFLSIFNLQSMIEVRHFQVVIIYLISFSLIFSSILQLSFARFAADQLFFKKPQEIAPNFNGAMLFMIVLSGIVGGILVFLIFPKQSFILKNFINASFIILCVIWLATSLLAGIKAYKTIFWAFLIGYGLTVITSYSLRSWGVTGLLFGFLFGQSVLLVMMLYTIYFTYPSKQLIKFDCLNIKKIHVSLIFSSLFYNLGLWIDKYIFWFHHGTSQVIFGSLRASIIYDLPIFWAYLSIIPGMAVFLIGMETNFADYYKKFCDDAIGGKSYGEIERARNALVVYARQAIMSLIKTQMIVALLIFILSPIAFKVLKISPLYLYLLYILVIAAALNVVFWGLLNIFDYLDKRMHVLLLTFLFV